MRIDVYLTGRGYAPSRARAKFLIGEGAVTVDGVRVSKPSLDIDESVEHTVIVDGGACPFVSVGGMKLDAALDRFGVDADSLICVDIGSSTGGFTDCLLSRGAAKVYAVDSGTSQLHEKLRADERVVVMENKNARELTRAEVGGAQLVVCDVSFISQTMILPAVADILDPDGTFVTLIKPQFELDRASVGRGIVNDPADRARAISSVIDAAARLGLYAYALTVSPVEGGGVNDERAKKRGNREYLASLKRGLNGTFTHTEIADFVKHENSVNTAIRHK